MIPQPYPFTFDILPCFTFLSNQKTLYLLIIVKIVKLIKNKKYKVYKMHLKEKVKRFKKASRRDRNNFKFNFSPRRKGAIC